jgi:purine-binding chemotaxis protein CheW
MSIQTTQYLFFILDGEEYAVKAEDVKEIVDFSTITKVQNANPCVKGIINIRGDLIPVIDPKVRFNLDETSVSKRVSFIIFTTLNKTKDKKIPIAMMVDMVNEVDDIDKIDILPTPEFGTKIESKYIENIIKYEDKYVLALDIASVLNIIELSKTTQG